MSSTREPRHAPENAQGIAQVDAPVVEPAHAPEDVIVWHAEGGLTFSALARQAGALMRTLPDATQVRYAINVCERRCNFLLGFLAAAARGQVTLLPSNRAPLALRELEAAHPGSVVLTDEFVEVALQRCDAAASPSLDFTTALAQNSPDREVAIVFTSGSTGRPEGHGKQWHVLIRTAQLLRQRLLSGRRYNIVATVPSQHMYGLETTVMLTWVSGGAVSDSHPFFPQDIACELSALPPPRMWVTTPAHLRACLSADVELPELGLILCATAPLDPALAQAAEERWCTPVQETFGCTEAGSMATRRTAQSVSWQLYPGLRLEQTACATQPDEGVQVLVYGDHLPAPVPLQDRVRLEGADRFQLLGRATDLIKVAGKRASLSDLTHRLLQVPGVVDGVIFVPRADERPAALVVAPSLDRQTVLSRLAERIDPAFLPRPLLLVEALPRNGAGKLPREALLAALSDVSGVAIDSNAPYLAGHFPGNPIVPGVVILEEVLMAVNRRHAAPVCLSSVPSVKFMSPLRPGERLQIEINQDATAVVKFRCHVQERTVAEGVLHLRTAQS